MSHGGVKIQVSLSLSVIVPPVTDALAMPLTPPIFNVHWMLTLPQVVRIHVVPARAGPLMGVDPAHSQLGQSLMVPLPDRLLVGVIQVYISINFKADVTVIIACMSY